MNNSHLDFVIRKNKGKSLLDRYNEIFISAGFNNTELEHLDLEQSDRLLDNIRKTFRNIDGQIELLPETSLYTDSKLLTSTLNNAPKACFIFSDDVYYCGMYRTTIELARSYCLNVAKDGYSHTCFLLDVNFEFSFTINFYTKENIELKNTYDIQLKVNPNHTSL